MRARSASARISAEIALTVLVSARRITGVMSPPSIATATPISECRAEFVQSGVEPLIPLDGQIQMRERAVHMRQHHLRRLPDVGFVELGAVVDAEQ